MITAGFYTTTTQRKEPYGRAMTVAGGPSSPGFSIMPYTTVAVIR